MPVIRHGPQCLAQFLRLEGVTAGDLEDFAKVTPPGACLATLERCDDLLG
jgi:hypothetical protein